MYKRHRRRFQFHDQAIADSVLLHYYPFTTNYFNNHRISKRVYNDSDPEFPNTPAKKVKLTIPLQSEFYDREEHDHLSSSAYEPIGDEENTSSL